VNAAKNVTSGGMPAAACNQWRDIEPARTGKSSNRINDLVSQINSAASTTPKVQASIVNGAVADFRLW
jgi:hypothetical protein